MANKNAAFEKAEKRKLQETVENGKQRISDLDAIISRTYEDNILGKLSDERYMRMSADYKEEQRGPIQSMADSEKRLQEMEQKTVDLKLLLSILREATDIPALNQTLVNKLIRRIEVHNNDKYDGHCHVKVGIYFTAIGMIDIPTEAEIEKLVLEMQKTPKITKLTA